MDKLSFPNILTTTLNLSSCQNSTTEAHQRHFSLPRTKFSRRSLSSLQGKPIIFHLQEITEKHISLKKCPSESMLAPWFYRPISYVTQTISNQGM